MKQLNMYFLFQIAVLEVQNNPIFPETAQLFQNYSLCFEVPIFFQKLIPA